MRVRRLMRNPTTRQPDLYGQIDKQLRILLIIILQLQR